MSEQPYIDLTAAAQQLLEEGVAAAFAAPRGHVWGEQTFATVTHTGCTVCGIVQRRDGAHGPCEGPGKVDLRAPAMPRSIDWSSIVHAHLDRAIEQMFAEAPPAPEPPTAEQIWANIHEAMKAIEQATTTIACHPDDQAALEAELAKRRAAGEVWLVNVMPTWVVPGEYIVVQPQPELDPNGMRRLW